MSEKRNKYDDGTAWDTATRHRAQPCRGRALVSSAGGIVGGCGNDAHQANPTD